MLKTLRSTLLAIFIVLALASSAFAASYAQQVDFLLNQVRSSVGSLAGGTVTFYEPGTTTLKTIWSDRTKATVAANPYTLDTNGTAQLYGDGIYKVVIKNAAGSTVYTRDNVSFIWPRDNYEVDALYDYGSGSAYTAATIQSAITAIGSTTTTLVLRAGTWAITADLTVPANVTLRPLAGAILTVSTGKTLTINGPFEAGLYQVFSCTGTGKVVYAGKKYPEWWGAKDDSGTTTTVNNTAFNAALAAGGNVYVAAPTGGYYSITDALTVAVANTKIKGNGAKIVQATANKGAFAATVSGVEIDGLELQGPWVVGTTYQTSASAIYAYGASYAARITDIKVKNCKIHNWGWAGVKFQYVDRPETENNYIYDVRYAGIIGLMTPNPKSKFDRVNGVYGGSASGVAVGIAFAATTVDAEIPRYGTITSPTIMNVGYQGILLEPAQYFTISDPVIVDCKIGITEGQWNDAGDNYLVSKFNTITNPVIVNLTLDNATDEARTAILMGGPDDSHPNIGSAVVGGSVYGYGGVDSSPVTFGAIDLRYSTGISVVGTNIHNSYKFGMKLTSVSYSSIKVNIKGVQATGGTAGILANGGNDYTLIEGCNIESGALAAIGTSVADNLLIIGSNQYFTTAANAINNRLYFFLKHHKDGAEISTSTGDLKYVTVGANSMAVNSMIKFRAGGAKTGAGGTKTITLNWGAQTVDVHAAAADTNDWYVEGEIIASATNTQSITWRGWNGTTMLAGYLAGTQDTAAGDIVLKLTCACADAGDRVKQRIWIVDREY